MLEVESLAINERDVVSGPPIASPQMTQITQIKTRSGCDGICVNLRDLRASRVGGRKFEIRNLMNQGFNRLMSRG